MDLTAIPGISVMTVLMLLTELGPNLSAFKSAAAFASWLCLCPDNDTSAGKVLRRQSRRSQQRVRQALRMAAASLYADTKAAWARNSGACGPGWERPRPSRPWPTNMRASSGTC